MYDRVITVRALLGAMDARGRVVCRKVAVDRVEWHLMVPVVPVGGVDALVLNESRGCAERACG